MGASPSRANTTPKNPTPGKLQKKSPSPSGRASLALANLYAKKGKLAKEIREKSMQADKLVRRKPESVPAMRLRAEVEQCKAELRNINSRILRQDKLARDEDAELL